MGGSKRMYVASVALFFLVVAIITSPEILEFYNYYTTGEAGEAELIYHVQLTVKNGSHVTTNGGNAVVKVDLAGCRIMEASGVSIPEKLVVLGEEEFKHLTLGGTYSYRVNQLPSLTTYGVISNSNKSSVTASYLKIVDGKCYVMAEGAVEYSSGGMKAYYNLFLGEVNPLIKFELNMQPYIGIVGLKVVLALLIILSALSIHRLISDRGRRQ